MYIYFAEKCVEIEINEFQYKLKLFLPIHFFYMKYFIIKSYR